MDIPGKEKHTMFEVLQCDSGVVLPFCEPSVIIHMSIWHRLLTKAGL